jgi:hypothetical protein
MKTQHMIGLLVALLVVLPLVAVMARAWGKSLKEVATNSVVKLYDGGIIPLAAEVTITTRHLLVQKGSADGGFIVNVANTRPWGVCLDEPDSGDKASVQMLGCGLAKMVAGEAVEVGDKLWTGAAGKVLDTHSLGAFLVGRAVTAAAADGDIVLVQTCFPVLDASGTTL